jgi:uncharacterized membrane protein
MWLLFAALSGLVLLTRERTLLDSGSFLRQRYAALPALMLLHGIPGALALTLGVFQFSDSLRRRYIALHRKVGYVYIASVAISAPIAVAVAYRLPIPTLLFASMIQASGWLVTTATALYCVRVGNIAQHREWMMRSYPFAAVFVLVRAIDMIPALDRMGLAAVIPTVWSVVALAGILPSFVIAWQKLPKKRTA